MSHTIVVTRNNHKRHCMYDHHNAYHHMSLIRNKYLQLTANRVLQFACLCGWSKKHMMCITIIVLECLSVVSYFCYDTATIKQFWI